jgi:hypothetical protein
MPYIKARLCFMRSSAGSQARKAWPYEAREPLAGDANCLSESDKRDAGHVRRERYAAGVDPVQRRNAR